jgi:hypothetical protein
VGLKRPDCQECQRLWQEYSDAVFDYVRLDGQLKMAALRDEEDAVEELRKGAAAAVARRDSAQARFREHETTHPVRAATA